MELRVEGAAQLGAVSQALKGAPKELRRELFRAINTSTKPLRQQTRDNILAVLPKRGGAAQAVHADTKIGARRRGRGGTVGLRIEARSKRDVRGMNRGRLRHPVYGHRDRWVTQSIPPRWFDEPLEQGAPQVRAELLAGLNRLAGKIARQA